MSRRTPPRARNPKTFGVPMAGREFGKRFQEGSVFNLWPSFDLTAGAVWRFDNNSTTVIDLVNNEDYAAVSADADDLEFRIRPQRLSESSIFATRHVSATKWQQDTPAASVDPGSSDFVVVALMQNDTNYNFNIIDFDTTGGTTEGFSIGKVGTNLTMFVSDGTNTGTFQWSDANGATALEDGTIHKMRVIFDKSEALVGVELDGSTQTVTKAAGSDLSAIGSITPAGGLAIAGREDATTLRFANDHLLFYIAFAHDVNYDVTEVAGLLN